MTMVVHSDAASLSISRYGCMDNGQKPSRAAYYLTLAVLVVGFFLVIAGVCQADDLLKAGNAAVNDTVGKDSSVMRWLLMLEVLSAIFGFILTKNMKILGGIVALSIFINICYSIIS